MIDQFEQSKEFIEFLKQNELLTNEAYANVVKNFYKDKSKSPFY